MHELRQIIEQAWEDRAGLSSGAAPARIGDAVGHLLDELDRGSLRVAEKVDGRRTTHQWIKKAVLLSFRLKDNGVISTGVYIGTSTKIYDRVSGEVICGRIPEGSVVVAGNLPAADGKYSLYCAVIVKRVDAQTRARTAINERLRD